MKTAAREEAKKRNMSDVRIGSTIYRYWYALEARFEKHSFQLRMLNQKMLNNYAFYSTKANEFIWSTTQLPGQIHISNNNTNSISLFIRDKPGRKKIPAQIEKLHIAKEKYHHIRVFEFDLWLMRFTLNFLNCLAYYEKMDNLDMLINPKGNLILKVTNEGFVIQAYGKHYVLKGSKSQPKYLKPLNIELKILEDFDALYDAFYSINSYLLRKL